MRHPSSLLWPLPTTMPYPADIKPSNILCNSAGAIKLCDFNVAGIQAGSVNKTFIGTSLYMAPERIKAQRYNIKADVWYAIVVLPVIVISSSVSLKYVTYVNRSDICILCFDSHEL